MTPTQQAHTALDTAHRYLDLLARYPGQTDHHAWIERHCIVRATIALYAVAEHPDQARLVGRPEERRLPLN